MHRAVVGEMGEIAAAIARVLLDDALSAVEREIGELRLEVKSGDKPALDFEAASIRGWSREEGARLGAVTYSVDEGNRGGTFTLGTTGQAAGGTMNLNARAGHEREAYGQTLRLRNAGGFSGGIDGLYSEWNGELAGDWSRPLGRGWSTKVLALGRAQNSRFAEAARTAASEQFASDNRTKELVARATVQRQGAYRFLPELGGEIAWNGLENRFRTGAANDRRTSVAELRREIFVNGTYAVFPAVRLEGGMAFERSRIGLRSGGMPDRQLQFWKPSLAMVWDAAKQTQFRFGIRRSVGQLDFEGFAASGDLVNDRPIAGNTELRPERTTTWSSTIDHRFGQGGALSLTISREKIEDALAYVPLSQGAQALANFGSVRLWRFKGKASVATDAVVSGGRITLDADIARTRRMDPVTRAFRADAREKDNVVNIAWRQDLSRIRSAWGVAAGIDLPRREWFVDQYQRTREIPEISAYVETMLPGNVKATLTGSGLPGYSENRRRIFFSPDRTGTVTTMEDRVRRNGAYVTLLLSRPL